MISNIPDEYRHHLQRGRAYDAGYQDGLHGRRPLTDEGVIIKYGDNCREAYQRGYKEGSRWDSNRN